VENLPSTPIIPPEDVINYFNIPESETLPPNKKSYFTPTIHWDFSLISNLAFKEEVKPKRSFRSLPGKLAE
jgi:hypothetical protein